MFDVFRFAWFAVRTFLGFILVVLAIHAAMWAFVKIHSMATRDADPDAALRLVNSYNARAIRKDQERRALVPAGTNDCSAPRDEQCAHH